MYLLHLIEVVGIDSVYLCRLIEVIRIYDVCRGRLNHGVGENGVHICRWIKVISKDMDK